MLQRVKVPSTFPIHFIMLKHLTLLLLILSSLSYSSVWAMNGHDDTAGKHQQALSQLVDDSHSTDLTSDQGNHLDEDHCCHAGAHLLGLIGPFAKMPPHVAKQDASIYSSLFHSHQTSPLQRPPLS